MNSDLQQEISRLAYELFEKRGGTDGQDLDDWLMAERITVKCYSATEQSGNGKRAPQKKRKTTTSSLALKRVIRNAGEARGKRQESVGL